MILLYLGQSAGQTCTIDGAFNFTGASNSFLTAPATGLIGGGGGFTMCVWVYRTRSGHAYDRIIDFGSGARADNVVMAFQNGMVYEVFRGGSSAWLSVYSSPFPANTWKHVCVVQTRPSTAATRGPAAIYWDGVEMVSGCSSWCSNASMHFPRPVARSGLYVGKSHWGPDPLFTGSMRDLLVFNVALSITEMNELRLGGGLPASTPPLVSMMRTRCGAAPPPSPPPSPLPAPPPTYVFLDRMALLTAVNAWCANATTAAATFGHISGWNIAQVTDLSNAFSGCSTFNDDISNWDTSSVTRMSVRRRACVAPRLARTRFDWPPTAAHAALACR
jgi:surface protein